jgi:hypothetical protein
VPVPNWVKNAIDCWTAAAQIEVGRLFREDARNSVES